MTNLKKNVQINSRFKTTEGGAEVYDLSRRHFQHLLDKNMIFGAELDVEKWQWKSHLYGAAQRVGTTYWTYRPPTSAIAFDVQTNNMTGSISHIGQGTIGYKLRQGSLLVTGHINTGHPKIGLWTSAGSFFVIITYYEANQQLHGSWQTKQAISKFPIAGQKNS